MREWINQLDEIDQDCVHQYEYLLGRELKNYEEYIEIDSKVMEMVLEYETRGDFFEYYPELLQYANPVVRESLQEANEQNAAGHQDEFIEIWGRLGISLNVTPQEFAVLNGENERVAQDLLVTLIQSDRCQMNGNTYFPYRDEALRPDNPEEDLEFELDRAPLSLHQNPGKAYTIALANNTDYEIKVLGPYFSSEETLEELRRLYMETRRDVGKDRIVDADCDFFRGSFKVVAAGDELYYANIKEMNLDRSERGRSSTRDHSAVHGVEQPQSLADRISSAKAKSDRVPQGGSAPNRDADYSDRT